MKILDHGSVELVDSMASDQSVLRAMLISTGKDEELRELLTKYPSATDEVDEEVYIAERKAVDRNKGRINYLMREKHGTPFEHNSFIFRVTAPIFVFREWHRHRIGWSYNEQSGRYMELGDKWYIPTEVRTRVGKPGHYTYQSVIPEQRDQFQYWLTEACNRSYEMYKTFLRDGIAPEQARMFLHVNHYSSMYATCNARSLMAFLELRNASTAQWEIQQYAQALENIFAEKMPVTYAAFISNGRIAP